MDNMIQKLEKYANNLEDIVEERTQQLVEEKKKTDTLLYRMLPEWEPPRLIYHSKHSVATINNSNCVENLSLCFFWPSIVKSPLSLSDFHVCEAMVPRFYTMFMVQQKHRGVSEARTAGAGRDLRPRDHLLLGHRRLHAALLQQHAHAGRRPAQRPVHALRSHHWAARCLQGAAGVPIVFLSKPVEERTAMAFRTFQRIGPCCKSRICAQSRDSLLRSTNWSEPGGDNWRRLHGGVRTTQTKRRPPRRWDRQHGHWPAELRAHDVPHPPPPRREAPAPRRAPLGRVRRRCVRLSQTARRHWCSTEQVSEYRLQHDKVNHDVLQWTTKVRFLCAWLFFPLQGLWVSQCPDIVCLETP